MTDDVTDDMTDDGADDVPMGPLERLIAVNEISDLIGRYCMLFDDEDWAGLLAEEP